MLTAARKLFSVRRMVPEKQIIGEIPTSKEIYQNLTRVALPSVIEMVFMSLIGAVDVVMIAPLGYEAVAAVGLAGQPRMLMLSLFFALNVGVTAIVARRKGENRPQEANLALRNALVFILLMTFVVMTGALRFSRNLMQLAGAQADTINMSETYFRILAFFLPVNVMTMCINAAQRGIGNTRTTMYVNLISNMVNVVFNYLMIYGKGGFPAMGVAGAAWATGVGICAGFVLCIYALVSKRNADQFLRLSWHDNWRLHRETMKSILKVGGNAMVEQVVVRVGFFAYAAIVASLGTQAFAAHQVGMQFLNISFTFGDGIAVAGTSLVGQMLGAKRPDMATIYGKSSQRLAMIASVVLASTFALLRQPLVSIFLNPALPENAVPFAMALDVMMMVALFQLVQTSSVVISGCLRGAGDNLYVALVMLICVGGIRPILSLFAVHVLNIGLVGTWSASLLDMCIRLLLVYRRFSSGRWQSIKI